MASRITGRETKMDINILKEVGYILLLITFFVGIIIGAFSLKNVNSSNFDAYSESLSESITKVEESKLNFNYQKTFIQGLEIIVIFWIVGMSVVGTPILIAFLGYKGYSLGYTIATVIRVIGTAAANKYVFQNMFLENAILVFIMIFLANYSIKISKNFFEKKANIKIDAIKYTIISTFMAFFWVISYGLVVVI